MRRQILLSLALVVITAAVYWPVRTCDFINLDDPDLVTANAHVQNGLTWEGVRWAFRPGHGYYWHPMPWLSHMLDVQLFGQSPAGPHLVNLLFHALNAVLLFLCLQQMTGALWRSGFVAALFALHPLRVESVAWVAERKDVLAVLFWVLTVWAYAHYARSARAKQTVDPATTRLIWLPLTRLASPQYALALLFFIFGLSSKPLLVTLPFALLLLDFWPLNRIMPDPSPNPPAGRFQAMKPWLSSLARLSWEKLFFFVFSAGSILMTLPAARSAIEANVSLPLDVRLATAVIAYIGYLHKALWPVGLAPMYLHPGQWPMAWVVAAGVLLAVLSWAALSQSCRRPYLFTGWCWYLGTLVPVIGILQAGVQWMADRFSYVPLIGVFILVVWGLTDLWAHWRFPRAAGALLGALILLACALRTRDQLRHWQDSESLFRHTLAVTHHNYFAHHFLATALQPGSPEAEEQFLAALRLRPHYAPALCGLGNMRAQQGRLPEARSCFQKAVESAPRLAKAHGGLAKVLVQEGRLSEGLGHYHEALRLDPDLIEALNNLAWTLATAPDDSIRDGPAAVAYAERACRLTGFRTTIYVGTLAAAYAAAGRFPEAVDTAQRAVAMARAAEDEQLAAANVKLLESYRAGRAWVAPAPTW